MMNGVRALYNNRNTMKNIKEQHQIRYRNNNFSKPVPESDIKSDIARLFAVI